MKHLLLLLLLGKFISCNNSAHQSNAESANKNDTIKNDFPDSKKPNNTSIDISGCYMKVVQKDTAILVIEQKGNEINGKMLYDNFQKDGSRGTVKGKQDGDILKLFYDFNSEGMHSVMEVYFKIVPGGLLRGIGSMDVKVDTAYFISGINYSEKEAFSKIDCSLVKEKF